MAAFAADCPAGPSTPWESTAAEFADLKTFSANAAASDAALTRTTAELKRIAAIGGKVELVKALADLLSRNPRPILDVSVLDGGEYEYRLSYRTSSSALGEEAAAFEGYYAEAEAALGRDMSVLLTGTHDLKGLIFRELLLYNFDACDFARALSDVEERARAFDGVYAQRLGLLAGLRAASMPARDAVLAMHGGVLAAFYAPDAVPFRPQGDSAVKHVYKEPSGAAFYGIRCLLSAAQIDSSWGCTDWEHACVLSDYISAGSMLKMGKTEAEIAAALEFKHGKWTPYGVGDAVRALDVVALQVVERARVALEDGCELLDELVVVADGGDAVELGRRGRERSVKDSRDLRRCVEVSVLCHGPRPGQVFGAVHVKGGHRTYPSKSGETPRLMNLAAALSGTHAATAVALLALAVVSVQSEPDETSAGGRTY